MRAVNLLPADLRGAVKAPAPVNPAPEESGSSSGAFFALGALALCVLGLAGYVLTNNTIKQSETDLAALEDRSAAVQAELARLKPYADFASLAQARIATVRDLAAQRFDWEGALRDLSRALPQEVSVRELNGSISGSAGGTNPLRGAIDVPAIEIVGCTSDHPAVAATMARLRAVDGVTRVSLATSIKSEMPDTPAADASSIDDVTGCEGKGKGDPADFNVVVFFENDVDAAADPAAPAASAASTDADGADGADAPEDEASQSGETTDSSVSTSTEAE